MSDNSSTSSTLTVRERILCELKRAARKSILWEKNDLIMYIYLMSKRQGHKLKLSSIDRYLRYFVGEYIRRRESGGEVYYVILSSRMKGVRCDGIRVEGTAGARGGRDGGGLLRFIRY